MQKKILSQFPKDDSLGLALPDRILKREKFKVQEQ